MSEVKKIVIPKIPKNAIKVSVRHIRTGELLEFPMAVLAAKFLGIESENNTKNFSSQLRLHPEGFILVGNTDYVVFKTEVEDKDKKIKELEEKVKKLLEKTEP